MTTHYVYRCRDKAGRLLYVGSSRDVPKRVAAHRARSAWGLTVTSVEVAAYATKADALAAEREAIKTEQPRWNTNGKWATRGTWTAQDYLDYIEAHRGRMTSRYVRDHVARAERELLDLIGGRTA